MSPRVTQSPASVPEQANEPEDLDSQITGIRQQVVALQRELADLEQRQREIKRKRALAIPSVLPAVPRLQSKSVNWTLLIASALSLALVCGGQFVLLRTHSGMQNEGQRQILAGGMLIAGALLFGAFMPPVSNVLPRLEFSSEDGNATTFDWRDRRMLGWLSASVLLAIVAILMFIANGENGIVVLVWLTSILALGISQMRGVRVKPPHILSQERSYLAILMVVLLVALATRTYHLTTLPYNVDGDFADVGLQARALATGQQHNIFAFGWADVPILGYLPPWLTMKLFGDGLAGLNASGVVEGLLIIVGVYLLGRDLFHARVGLIAAALMTISYTHLAASRQSSYIDPVFFLVYAIYFLLLGLREKRMGAIVTSAIMTTLCLEMYYSGRIVIIIIGFILLFLLIFHRSWLKSHGWALVLWGLAILITFGPMLVVFARAPDTLVSHTRSVLITNPDIIKHMQSVYQVDTLPAMLLQQIRHTLLIFHYYGDTGTQFGFRRPFLDPFTAILFTLGLGYTLFRWRQFGNSLILVWTVLGVLLGCFLTVNPPFWARLMILLPATILLAALALNLIYERFHNAFQSLGNRGIWIAPALIVLFISVVGILNWNTYVSLKGTYATPRTRIARYLADQPASKQAYLVSADYRYDDREFEFLSPERLTGNLTSQQFDGDLTFLDQSRLIILTPEQVDLLDRLKQSFPNGSYETHRGNAPDEVAFYVYRIH